MAKVKIQMYFLPDEKSPQVLGPPSAMLIYDTQSICYQDKLSNVLTTAAK